jgi:phosphatidylglycerol phospholipase C
MSKIHDADRQLFVWTVNDERWMEWCLNKNAQGPVDAAAAALASSEKGSKALSSATDGEEPLLSSSAPADATSHLRLIDGVITDDPKLFLEVCARWEDEQDGTARPVPRPGPLSVLRTRLADAFGVVYFQAMAGLFYMLMRFYYKRLDQLPRAKSIKQS